MSSGVRAVLAAQVAALVDRHSLAAMEELDHAVGDPHFDFRANDGVWN